MSFRLSLFGCLIVPGLLFVATPEFPRAQDDPTPALTAEVGIEEVPPLPRIEPMRATRPARIPRALEAENDDMLAYVKMREPRITLQRLADWMTAIDDDNPFADADEIANTLRTYGLDIDELRPDAHLVLHLWRPLGDRTRPGWSLQIPAAADTVLQGMLRIVMPYQTTVGQDIVVVSDEETLAAVNAASGRLSDIALYGLRSEFQIYLHAKVLAERYGSQLRDQARAMRDMSNSIGLGNQSRDVQRMMRRNTFRMSQIIEQVASFIDQAQSLMLGINLSDDYAEFELTVTPLPDSPLASLFDRQPVDMPDLTALLGSDHTVRVQVSVDEVGRMAQLAARPDANPTTDPLVLQDPDALPDGMLKLLADDLPAIAHAGPQEVALAFDLYPDQPATGAMLVHADDPASIVNAATTYPDLIRLPILMMLGTESTYNFSLIPDARVVEARPVHQAILALSTPPGFMSIDLRLFQRILDNAMAPVEIMAHDQLAIFSLSQPIENILDEARLQSLQDSWTARRQFGRGAFLYVDFDLIDYISVLRSVGFGGEAYPRTDFPPLTFAGYHQEGRGYYRMRFPRVLIDAIRQLDLGRTNWNPELQNQNAGRRGGRSM